MDKKTQKLAKVVVATALSIGLTSVATQATAAAKGDAEKCYGIAKKAKNDCGVPGKHSCAAQAKVNGDPQEWMYVLKGNCDRIVGGGLTPEAAEKAHEALKKDD